MKKNLFLLLFFFTNCLCGCTTAMGPLFTEVAQAEYSGKAIVYFYRNSPSGSAVSYSLRINDGNSQPLMNKGYFLLILDPGAYNFTVSYNSKLLAENTFTFQEDKIYYARFHIDFAGWNPGVFGSRPMKNYSINSVPRDEALDVINECHLIEVLEKI